MKIRIETQQIPVCHFYLSHLSDTKILLIFYYSWSINRCCFVGDTTLSIKIKGCSLTQSCVNGSFNIGISRVSVSMQCCTTDLCNTQDVPGIVFDIQHYTVNCINTVETLALILMCFDHRFQLEQHQWKPMFQLWWERMLKQIKLFRKWRPLHYSKMWEYKILSQTHDKRRLTILYNTVLNIFVEVAHSVFYEVTHPLWLNFCFLQISKYYVSVNDCERMRF